MYTIFTCLYFKLTAAILACHSLPHLTFPYMVNDVTALCITTLSACSQRPHQRKYSAILFHDNTSANGTTLYHLVSQLHQRWHTSDSSFPHRWRYRTFPFSLPLHSQNHSHANKPTWLPVAQRLGRGMHAVQPSFWGEALPTYGGASPYPPPKNTYGGGRTLPYPNLCPSADPLPWGSSGAIAHSHPWGSSGAIYLGADLN